MVSYIRKSLNQTNDVNSAEDILPNHSYLITFSFDGFGIDTIGEIELFNDSGSFLFLEPYTYDMKYGYYQVKYSNFDDYFDYLVLTTGTVPLNTPQDIISADDVNDEGTYNLTVFSPYQHNSSIIVSFPIYINELSDIDYSTNNLFTFFSAYYEYEYIPVE